MKSKTLPILISLVVLLLIAIWIFKVYDINKHYPQSTKIEYYLNESMVYDEFIITQINNEILDYNELIIRYSDLCDVDFGANTDDLEFVLSYFNIKNNADEQNSLMLYNATFSTLTYSNGIDLLMFDAINDKNTSLGFELEPGEEINIILTFSIVKSQSGNIEKGEVLLNLYPQKISFVIECKKT